MRNFIFIIFFIVFCNTHTSEANQDAVVQLRIVYQDSVGYGTGFFFKNDGSLLTCYHVIEGAKRIEAINRNGEKWRDIKVIGFSPLYDMAILKVKTDNKLPTLSIAKECPDVFPNDDVHNIGILITSLAKIKPRSIEFVTDLNEAIFLEELFGQRKTFSEAGSKVKLYGIEATVSNGMSGSPVIYNGEVLGILSGSKSEGRDFAWIVPVKYLNEINNQVEQVAGEISHWPKLALMNNEWIIFDQFQRSNITSNKEEVRIDKIYSPIVTEKSAKVIVRPHNIELSKVIIDEQQAIIQPNGDFQATILFETDQTKNVKITAISERDNTIIDCFISITRIDLEKISEKTDQLLSEIVKTQSNCSNFESAFNTLNKISNIEELQKGRRYIGESLIEFGRTNDAIRFTDIIINETQQYYYLFALVKKLLDKDNVEGAVNLIDNRIHQDFRDEPYKMVLDYLLKNGNVSYATEIVGKINDRNIQFEACDDIARIELERNRSNIAASVLSKSKPKGNLNIGRKISKTIRIAYAQYQDGNIDASKETLKDAFQSAHFMEVEDHDDIGDKLDELLAVAIAQNKLKFLSESKTSLDLASKIILSINSQLRNDVLFKDELLIDMSATQAVIGNYQAAVDFTKSIVRPSKRTLAYIYVALIFIKNNDFQNARKIVLAIDRERDQLNIDDSNPYLEHRDRRGWGFKEVSSWNRSFYPMEHFKIEKIKFDIDTTDTDSSLGLVALKQAISGDIDGCRETLKCIKDVDVKDTVIREGSIQLMKNKNWHESYGFANEIRNSYLRAVTFIDIAKTETPQIDSIRRVPKAINIAASLGKSNSITISDFLSIYYRIIEYLIDTNAVDDALEYYNYCDEKMDRHIKIIDKTSNKDINDLAQMSVMFMKLLGKANLKNQMDEMEDHFKSVSSFYKKKSERFGQNDILPPKRLFMDFAIELAKSRRYQEAIEYAKMGYEEDEAMEHIVYQQCINKDFKQAKHTVELMDDTWMKERALDIIVGHEDSPEQALIAAQKQRPGYNRDNSLWNVALKEPDFLEKMRIMDLIEDQEKFQEQRIDMIMKWAKYRELQPLLSWLRSSPSVTPSLRFKAYKDIVVRYQ